MATGRKDEKRQRREQRLAAERREAEAARRRLMLGYVVAGALGLAVIVGLVLVLASGGGGGQANGQEFDPNAHVQIASGSVEDVPLDSREGTPPPPLQQADLQKAAQAAGCDLRLNLPDEGNTHVESNTVNYKTNPPTSGNHNIVPQADGAYSEMPDPIHFVHSLEHGRIEIQYSPDLPKRDQLALKGVFDESPDGVLFFPNPDMPYEVAATAWTQLLGCQTYEGDATLDAIRDFRDIYRGHGPEGGVPITL